MKELRSLVRKNGILYAVMIAVFAVTCFLSVVKTPAYTARELSAGSAGNISRIAVKNNQVLETDLKFSREDIQGISFYIRYGVGADITDQTLLAVLRDEQDRVLYQETLHIEEAGFVGDENDEGILFMQFSEPLPQGLYHLSIQAENLPAEAHIELEIRDGATISRNLVIDGTEYENSGLYGSYYTAAAGGFDWGTFARGIMLEGILAVIVFLKRRFPAAAEMHKDETADSPAKKSILVLCGLLLLETGAAEYGWHLLSKNQRSDVLLPPADTTVSILPGHDLSFKLAETDDWLCGVVLYRAVQDIEDNFTAVLADETGIVEEIQVPSVQTELRGQAEAYEICFDHVIKESSQREYVLSVENTGSEPLLLRGTDELQTPAYGLLYSVNAKHLTLYLACICLAVLATVTAWFGMILHMRSDWVFLMVFLLLGMSVSLLVKHPSVPDEYAHFDTAYTIANEISGNGISPFPNATYKRRCDIYADPVTKIRLSSSAYEWFYQELQPDILDEEPVLIYARNIRSDSTGLIYLPAAVGILAGKSMHLGFASMAMLARFLTLLTAGTILSLAVRVMPGERHIIFVLSLIPLTLCELGAVTPDALIIPLCFLLTACCLRTLQNPGRADYRMLAVILLITVLLTSIKGGMYLPLGLVSAYVFYRCFQSGSADRKNARIIITAVVLIASAAVILRYHHQFARVLFRSQGDAYSARRAQQSYSIPYLLAHPGLLFRILEGTVHYSVPGYFNGLVGRGVGWLKSYSVNQLLQYAYTLLLTFTVLTKRKEILPERKVFTVISVVSCVLCFAAMAMAMLTGWTQFGREYISGLQTRYFIPFLPLLIISVRRRLPLRNTPDERVWIFACSVLAALSVISLFISILA